MTIRVEVSPETEARLAAEAAARKMDLSAYAGALLEEATDPKRNRTEHESREPAQRATARKSLAQIFAESPLRGLDLEFERDQDSGRNVEL